MSSQKWDQVGLSSQLRTRKLAKRLAELLAVEDGRHQVPLYETIHRAVIEAIRRRHEDQDGG